MKKILSAVLSLFTAFSCMNSTYIINASDYQHNSEELILGDINDFNLGYPLSPVVASNFSDGAHVYRDYLDENNLQVYNSLKSLVDTPSLEKMLIKLPKSVSVTLSNLPTSPFFTSEDMKKYELALFGSCKPGIDSLLYDYPEFCWFDASQLVIGPYNYTTKYSFSKRTYTLTFNYITVTPSYYDGFSSLSEVNEYLDKLAETVDEHDFVGESRYDTLKNIHDYIAEFTYYDTYARFSGSALGALVEPGVVCEGYSKAFKILCDKLDIPCALVFGNWNRETNDAHMWDYVQMEDGKWYAVDVTWDDLDGDNGKEVKYEYFLKGSKSFNTVHVPENDYNITYFNYPELSETDYIKSDTPIITETTTSSTSVTTTETTILTTTTTSVYTTSTIKTIATTSMTSSQTTTSSLNTESHTTTSTSKTTVAPVILEGDVNKDGKVNVADLVCCVNSVLGRDDMIYDCDVNEDNIINAMDVVTMRKILLKQLFK